MRHHHGPDCGCPRRIVHPVRQNVVDQCTEDVVEHIHPSHTTIRNHHVTRNRHVYPHSTSVQNSFNSVDEFGGAFNVPSPPQDVAGATSPENPNQVAGAMSPGQGYPNQVAGAMDLGGHHNKCMKPGYHSPADMNNWQKPNKWC
ncbi:spore coat protein [Virgibacillus ndiopensis]|uniref:spore coat protein n=1 Tax=Virgibacillus ndiopensis TaxID=2004408 RepID=UPI000C085835|nr:spore coat protein [Virgibacillus ndiopensis]